MMFKDLAKRKERFVPGHRTCAGCAIPIIVRTVLSATEKPVVAANATGCLEVTSTIYPFSSWNIPWIHNSFENVSPTMSGVETAYRALRKRGKMEEDVRFVAFGGDGGTYDIGLQSLSGAMERGHDFLYVCYDNEGYMNCLSLDTLIMTENGLKRITEVKIGEKIYAFNKERWDLVLKKCTGIFDNGIKEIYEINTLHHTIKATSNHPFLTIKRRGSTKPVEFEWKTLRQLKKGDEIITLKKMKENKSYKFKPVKVSKKGDYKVNLINNVNIPKKSSPELMEFLGLYVGDGWTRTHKGEIGFAIPRDTKANKRLIALTKKIFKRNVNQKEKNYVYMYSVNLTRFIDSLGFGKGAKNKRIPPWIFTIPKEEKEAFIEGLMLSDGYKSGKSYRYVSASFELLKSLRLLLQTIEYQVGKIHLQTKKKGTNVVYRRLLEDSTCGYICFSKRRKPNISKYKNQIKQRNYLADSEYFDTERIVSIKKLQKEPTLDLRVEEEHNFVADGIVVHNTGGQRSSATPFGAHTTTEPAGKVKQGKEVFRKRLTEIAAAHGIPYVAQASVSNIMDLYSKAKKAFEMKGPKFMLVFSPCTTLWKFRPEETINVARLAVETRFWPLYEIENGKYKINYKPPKETKVGEFLRSHKRFAHLFKPENKELIERIQERVDSEWKLLLKRAEE